MAEIFVGSVNVGVVPNARNWERDLRRQLVPSAGVVGDEVGQQMSRKITDNMGKAGDKSAGAFSDTFQKRLRAALEKLPKAKLDADASLADRKIDLVRTRLEALSKKKIGVDMDANQAMEQLGIVEAELRKVQESSKDIELSFNTLHAREQLAMLKHEAAKAGNDTGLSLAENILGRIGMVGASSGAGAGQSGGISIAGMGPMGIAIAGALGLFALPFIAEAASAGIVTAFGGAIGAMAGIGAARNPEVAQTFTDMKDRVLQDFEIIGMSWVPVLEGILNTAKQTMDTLTPVFQHAADTIAGPFRQFGQQFIRAFAQPEVQKSIQAVADAFAQILNAITPQLANWMREFANAITDIANTLAKHPEDFARFINFLVQVAVFAVRALGWLTELAMYMTGRFSKNVHDMAHTWDVITNSMHKAWSKTINEMRLAWDQMCSDFHRAWSATTNRIHITWSATVNGIHQAWSDTLNFLHKSWSAFVNFFTGSAEVIHKEWSQLCNNIHRAWSTTINFIHDAWDGAVRWVEKRISDMWGVVHKVFGDILKAASWAFGWIPGIGPKLTDASNKFNGFKNNVNNSLAGIKDRTVNVGVNMTDKSSSIASPGFRAQYGKALGGYISTGTGPTSDDVPIWASRGEYMMPASSVSHYGLGFMDSIRSMRFAAGGLIPGLHLPSSGQIHASIWGQLSSFVSSAWHAIGGFFSRLVHGGSGGVQQWTATVSKALSMLSMSQGLIGRILYQMQTESGGNANAINLTDINAQMGDPSRGLMQVIGSTFAAYHVPGTSWNIYDPLANIAAAINYARHRYGPSLGALGSGHGYAEGGLVMDSGGWLPPGASTVFNFTGRPEQLLRADMLPRGGDGAVAYHAHFDGLTGAAIEAHVQTAFTAMALTQGALSRSGRRM